MDDAYSFIFQALLIFSDFIFIVIQKLTQFIVIIIFNMQRSNKKLEWSGEQIALLMEVYPMYESKKWKNISLQFKQKGFVRTEVEIREKWINFIDPQMRKDQWCESQLEKMFDIYDQVGTKWCVIQKTLGRTQNTIKNKFYGTLRNFLRFVIVFLDSKVSSFNEKISKFSPKFLNLIYKAQNQFQFLGQEIKDTIHSMHFKIDKQMLEERIKIKKNLYVRLKNVTLKIFARMEKTPKCQKEKGNTFSAQPKGQTVKIQEEEMGESQPLSKQIKQEAHSQGEYPLQGNKFLQMSDMQNETYYPFLNYHPFCLYGQSLHQQF